MVNERNRRSRQFGPIRKSQTGGDCLIPYKTHFYEFSTVLLDNSCFGCTVLCNQPIPSVASGTSPPGLDLGKSSKLQASIKEAYMWGREEKLVRLYEELDTLYVFDRIHDYGADVRNRGDDNAYASRQERRSEILTEIAKLRVRNPWFEGFGAQMLKHCHFTH
jgi:hypothetical protein